MKSIRVWDHGDWPTPKTMEADIWFKCHFACFKRPQFISSFVFLSEDQHEMDFSPTGDRMNIKITLLLKLRVQVNAKRTGVQTDNCELHSSQHSIRSPLWIRGQTCRVFKENWAWRPTEITGKVTSWSCHHQLYAPASNWNDAAGDKSNSLSENEFSRHYVWPCV